MATPAAADQPQCPIPISLNFTARRELVVPIRLSSQAVLRPHALLRKPWNAEARTPNGMSAFHPWQTFTVIGGREATEGGSEWARSVIDRSSRPLLNACAV